MNSTPTFIVVDLFCGAGGTTTGFEMTHGLPGQKKIVKKSDKGKIPIRLDDKTIILVKNGADIEAIKKRYRDHSTSWLHKVKAMKNNPPE